MAATEQLTWYMFAGKDRVYKSPSDQYVGAFTRDAVNEHAERLMNPLHVNGPDWVEIWHTHPVEGLRLYTKLVRPDMPVDVFTPPAPAPPLPPIGGRRPNTVSMISGRAYVVTEGRMGESSWEPLTSVDVERLMRIDVIDADQAATLHELVNP